MMLVKLWSEGYKCTKTGILFIIIIFCRTESVAMTLKIVCTYAHYVTLGSRCKMASNHRKKFQFESPRMKLGRNYQ